MLSVANNIMGLNTHRNLKIVSGKSQKASERLSSGSKINRSADDAAGLAIREKMRNQITGLNMANKNVLDGVSTVKIMDSGMSEITEMLSRQRELTIQAMNDTNAPEDRAKIQLEIEQLSNEITETASKCQFNTIPLLTLGSDSEIVSVGVGNYHQMWFDVEPGDSLKIILEDMTVPGGQNTTVYGIGVSSTSGGASYNYDSDYNVGSVNPHGFADSITISQPSSTVDHGGGKNSGDGSIEINNAAANSRWAFAFTNVDVGNSSQPASSDFKITVIRTKADGTVVGGATPLLIKSGANENQQTYIDRYDCRAASLGVSGLVVDPVAAAELSLKRIDKATDLVNSYRANAGAQQNRLEHTDKSLMISSENLSAAQSRISDTDMAKEMMEFTKSNILSQAGMSMLAQANQAPNKVMTLLQ